ncbi:hypothetical protein LTR27_012518 [Elasticomyces elasticus]|nr:hypothetical protein LTR27_012518 [Elasticomyces elasticus]
MSTPRGKFASRDSSTGKARQPLGDIRQGLASSDPIANPPSTREVGIFQTSFEPRGIMRPAEIFDRHLDAIQRDFEINRVTHADKTMTNPGGVE